MSIFPRLLRGPRRIHSDEAGNAIVEFALLCPVLTLLAVGIGDFGVPLWQKAQLGNAARAGTQYVSLHGYNSTAAQNAATSATNLPATATATTYCGCAGTTGVTSATCGTSCSDGTTAGSYASVSVTSTYRPMLPVLWGGSTVTLTSTAITRY